MKVAIGLYDDDDENEELKAEAELLAEMEEQEDPAEDGVEIAIRAFRMFFDGMPLSAIARELNMTQERLLCFLPFTKSLCE